MLALCAGAPSGGVHVPTITSDRLDRLSSRSENADTRLRALLDAAVDAIVTIDHRGVIESVNPAAERMFGYAASEMLGSNVSMLMTEEHSRAHDGYIQRFLMTGERHIIGIGREVEAQRKDGSVFPVDLAVTEFELSGERMFMGLIRDISDRRAAERAAQERLDTLAHAGRLADLGLTTSTIAHEVNQPLAAIVSFAHACQRMLDDDSADPALLRDALGQIAAQGERASAIIARVREMAMRRESAPEAVNLNDAVHSVLSLLGKQLSFDKVEVEEELANELPVVRADRVQVEQVVMNLLMNALDAMREVPQGKRRLHIRTANGGDEVRLTVRDTGPGLGQSELQRVFEHFYTTKSQGMGVGLSICRTLAEAHGGRLWAEARKGEGASFHLALPSGS
jgi:two-component system sensor kinase FixL